MNLRVVTGYLKLGGKTVMRHAAAAQQHLLFCPNLDGLAIACIKMVPSDQTPDNGDIKITVQSSLLFQELLDFNKPIQVRLF